MSADLGYPLIQGRPRQLAYVTTDLDRAVAQFARVGVARFTPSSESEIEVGRDRTARFRVALANVGETQLEVIEPTDGDVEVYRSLFTGDSEDGYELRFHHVAYWPNDSSEFTALRAGAEEAGFDVVIEGSGPFGSYFYLDTRDTLGHYLEYFDYSPGVLDSLREMIPAN